jgi:hypothetical protein
VIFSKFFFLPNIKYKMAGGGLIQLVSIGAQDVYLVGNPQITFFKVTYQRHTNFARECIEQTIQGTQGFNQRLTITVSRSGDLVGPMHVELALPSLQSNILGASLTTGVYTSASLAGTAPPASASYNWCWVNYVGYRILKEITIEIGGQPIDRHYSTWFYMWFELSTPAAKREGLQKMVGGYDVTEVPLGLTSNAINAQTLYVPLVFWFNTHPGLALPLIALQYHEVKLYIQTDTLANCAVLLPAFNSTSGFSNVLTIDWDIPNGSNNLPVYAADGSSAPTLTLSVWADYYYLDSEERRRFAQLSHEYLIKQVQQNTASFSSFTDKSSNQSIDYRTFNHPVSFNVWGFRKTTAAAAIDWTNFTNSPPFLQFLGVSIVDQHKLVLNGNDRYNDKNADYYNLVQPYNHFTAIPPVGILCYSYALQPVEHQPSGSLNFSRIDNAANKFSVISNVQQLNGLLGLTGSTNVWSVSGSSGYEGVVYAVNYNVLRIMSGMGGLAYSN